MRRILGALLAVLLLAACAGGDDPTAAPVGEASAEPAQRLDFTAPQLGAGQIEGSSLEGRDVVLWFWSPW